MDKKYLWVNLRNVNYEKEYTTKQPEKPSYKAFIIFIVCYFVTMSLFFLLTIHFWSKLLNCK